MKEAVLLVLESYAYHDQSLNLPEDYKDQQTEIVTDIKGIEVKDGWTLRDFYEAVYHEIVKFKDGHTNFVMPCPQDFRVVCPYSFNVETVKETDGNAKYTVKLAKFPNAVITD